MSRNYNLLELDIDRLFEDHKIDEIVEIEKLLNAEIERKRIELRSMVGDRYKDVLAASDAIKTMKTLSEDIVSNIVRITDTCETLITEDDSNDSKQSPEIDSKIIEERVLVIQIRLAMFINEQIWLSLDEGDNLKAAQFYLLAQHIHMGLNFTKSEYLKKLPLLKQIKSNLSTLKEQILSRICQKLEFVEITAEETSSNLNGLLLLQNQSTNELLNTFIEHRKLALDSVINSTHSSVRIQIGAMVKCLITTIHLLHDCFICWQNIQKGLIWQQLAEIIGDTTKPTITKLQLPSTQLIDYIPDIIKEFRPKCDRIYEETINNDFVQDWLQSTLLSIKNGVQTSLKSIINIKGLYLIREEVLKINLPENWERICYETKLPDNFNVWYYFFQNLLTQRVSELIAIKLKHIIDDLKDDIRKILNSKLDQIGYDLKQSTWIEGDNDVSRIENKHIGLSMKTHGYSQNIMDLCAKFDRKYLEILQDTAQYFYGREFDGLKNINYPSAFDTRTRKKFLDKDELENHLRAECANNSTILTTFLDDFLKIEQNLFVLKSITCARFLQAITNLCPHFHQCCSLNGNNDEWLKIGNYFSKSSIRFWQNWIDFCVKQTEDLLNKEISSIDSCRMIEILPKWDLIEIQEQTDEKIFKSQIKLPLKPSLLLDKVLNKLNDDIVNILPHTLPKRIHLEFLERNIGKILIEYGRLFDKNLNQNQVLQFLFDIKFLTTFCISRDNTILITNSQDICDKFRTLIDPFDLDVFYKYLQDNTKRSVIQSQVIYGCLLPSTTQLANLSITETMKEHEKEASILALSCPSMTSWFPLLPISVPTQKTTINSTKPPDTNKSTVMDRPVKTTTPKRSQDPAAVMRSSAAALFGGLTTDWFS